MRSRHRSTRSLGQTGTLDYSKPKSANPVYHTIPWPHVAGIQMRPDRAVRKEKVGDRQQSKHQQKLRSKRKGTLHSPQQDRGSAEWVKRKVPPGDWTVFSGPRLPVSL